MALRVLNYVTNFYMDYVESREKVKMLPPVFPILLYRGKNSWTAPVKMADLIDHVDVLGKYAPRFQYCQIAEQAYPPEELLTIRNIVSTLFLAETSDDEHLIIDELAALIDLKQNRPAVWLLINWFLQLITHGRKTVSDIEQLDQLYHTGEDVKSMLIRTLEDKFEEREAAARTKALAEGRTEGELIGAIQTLQLALRRSISDKNVLQEQNMEDLQRMRQELETVLKDSLSMS